MIEGCGCCYLFGFERLFHSAVIALRYPPPMFSFSLLGFGGLFFPLSIVQEDALHSNILMELRVGVEGWGALAGWAKKGTDEEGAIAGQGKREGHCRLGSFLVPRFGILLLFHFHAFIYLVNMLSWPRLPRLGIVTLAQSREENVLLFWSAERGRRGVSTRCGASGHGEYQAAPWWIGLFIGRG